MLKFRFENLSNLPQGDHVLKMENWEIQLFGYFLFIESISYTN